MTLMRINSVSYTHLRAHDFDENKLMASNDFIQENIDSEKVEQFLLKNQY